MILPSLLSFFVVLSSVRSGMPFSCVSVAVDDTECLDDVADAWGGVLSEEARSCTEPRCLD